jgi:hypothetical protein
VIQEVWFFYSPAGIGLVEEDGLIEKLIENPDFRAVEVKLNKAGLCPRCQVKLPFKFERPWRKRGISRW